MQKEIILFRNKFRFEIPTGSMLGSQLLDHSNIEQNLPSHKPENNLLSLPLVLDNINSSFVGKYHLYLIQFSTSSKTHLVQKPTPSRSLKPR